jgi:hypothetical protein
LPLRRSVSSEVGTEFRNNTGRSWDKSVGIATGYRLDHQVLFAVGVGGCFALHSAFYPMTVFPPGVKRPGHEADLSPLTNAGIMIGGGILPLPHTSRVVVVDYLSTDRTSQFLPLSRISSPPLWFSGRSSGLQIHRSGFDSRRKHIFGEVASLERGPLNLVTTIEELLRINSKCSCPENREFGRGDPLR